MRIAFFMGGLGSNGGIGRVVSLISSGLAEKNEVCIICFRPYNPQNSLYNIDPQVKIDSLNYTGSMRSFMLHGGLHKLCDYLRRNKIEVLIACGALFFPLSIFARQLTKVKCICWEHSNANNSADHSFQMICRRIGARHADAVVVLTKQDEKLFLDKYRMKRIVQIYNPVDERIQYGYQTSENPKRIISVGRLTYQKNYPLLIQVAKDVLRKHPDWIWDIYGEGPDRTEIEKLIKEAKLTDHLILKGQVNNLYELYGQYSFYVITSRYEGFGMAMLEANRTGLPIISFDVECGPREIIDDGVNGYLVPAQDLELMTERVNELCESREKCLEMSENIQNNHSQFGRERIIKQWNRLFDTL